MKLEMLEMKPLLPLSLAEGGNNFQGSFWLGGPPPLNWMRWGSKNPFYRKGEFNKGVQQKCFSKHLENEEESRNTEVLPKTKVITPYENFRWLNLEIVRECCYAIFPSSSWCFLNLARQYYSDFSVNYGNIKKYKIQINKCLTDI